MDLNIPVGIINMLRCWYEKVNSAVRWGTEVSKHVKLSAGVRQGGVLSPFLFAVYVNDVLSHLADSKLGCFIKCTCLNSFMYADDLILISISLMHLQLLVDICKQEFDKIDMQINGSKSGCLRIGPRHAMPCEPININNMPLCGIKKLNT
jgi:hypothetical protein